MHAAPGTPAASGAKPAAGSRMAVGRDGCAPGRGGGKGRDGGADDEVLGLFGIGNQAGKQIAAVSAGKPGGDEPFQATYGQVRGLEAEPDAVAGEPLGVTGGTAQYREHLHGADGD